MSDHITFCELDTTCGSASYTCITCEASFDAGYLAGAAHQKKVDAEKCRNLVNGDHLKIIGEAFAKAIEGE